jgi:hypothetical protein
VPDARPAWRRWLPAAVTLLILAVVVWFVGRTIVEAWSQLGQHPWQFHVGWIVAAGGFYLLALLPPALFWYQCLWAMGQHPHFFEAIRAYYIGHLGKYVPGKAMVVVIRAGLIGGRRVDVGVAAASVFLETLTWFAVGSFLAAGYLVATASRTDTVFWAALALMIATGLPTLPAVFPRLARLAGVGRADPEIVEKLHRLRFGTIFLGWFLMTVGWILMGMAYWATLRALGFSEVALVPAMPRFTAAVALATAAGFIAVVVPAGVGVREAALVKIIIPYLRGVTRQPELVAWAAALLLRLVSVVSELGISSILYAAGMSRRKAPPKEPPAP